MHITLVKAAVVVVGMVILQMLSGCCHQPPVVIWEGREKQLRATFQLETAVPHAENKPKNVQPHSN